MLKLKVTVKQMCIRDRWVSATMYLVGILLVLLGALLVKRITGQKYRKSFFIIELPEYKIPSLKRACISMLERGKAYIIKAGTIILVCNTVVQLSLIHIYSVFPAMEELRRPVDELEMIVDKEAWPMPSYGDLLFEV